MKCKQTLRRAPRWELNWERVVESANRTGIALLVAGLLHGFTENDGGERWFLWGGAVLLAISLLRRKPPRAQVGRRGARGRTARRKSFWKRLTSWRGCGRKRVSAARCKRSKAAAHCKSARNS